MRYTWVAVVLLASGLGSMHSLFRRGMFVDIYFTRITYLTQIPFPFNIVSKSVVYFINCDYNFFNAHCINRFPSTYHHTQIWKFQSCLSLSLMIILAVFHTCVTRSTSLMFSSYSQSLYRLLAYFLFTLRMAPPFLWRYTSYIVFNKYTCLSFTCHYGQVLITSVFISFNFSVGFVVFPFESRRCTYRNIVSVH